MKGIKIEPEIDLQIDLNVTSYIPDEYIQDANQKIEVYQNIALCKNEQDIQNVIDEIIDRFGNMPKELENLIAIARIKYLAKQLKVIKIASTKMAGNSTITNRRTSNGTASNRIAKNKTVVVFTFEPNKFELDLNELVKKYGNQIKFSAGIKPMITLQIESQGNNRERQLLHDVTEFLSFSALSGTVPKGGISGTGTTCP